MQIDRMSGSAWAALPVWACCAVLALVSVLAPPPASAEETLPPEALVKNVVDVYRYASRRLRGKPEDVRHRLLVDLVNEKIMPTIDYPHVTREIFTNHWATLEEMGRAEEAITAVEDAFRARYVQSLKAFTNLKIRIFKAQIEGNRARVHVKVDAFNTFGNDVYFHRTEDGTWKVVDVSIVGLSIVGAVRQAVDKGVEAFGYEKVFDYMQQESEKAGG